MSTSYLSSLMIGVAVDIDDVYRVLSYKPAEDKTEMADIILGGRVVGQTRVPVRDQGTEQSWTVREEVYYDLDGALTAFCKPLGLKWNYASYGGDIQHVWFSPRYKDNEGAVSFRQMAGIIKDMPRVRRIVKRIFDLGKLKEGVVAVMETY